jgi:DNA-binding cell septation regulator SpoVG
VETYTQQKITAKPYAVVCIDVYSCYCLAQYSNSTSIEDYASSIKKIFEKMGKPFAVECDEEMVRPVKVNDPNISLFVSAPGERNKNVLVERVIKTLKRKILKYLSKNKLQLYKRRDGKIAVQTQRILDYVCEEYNKSFHSTIGAVTWNVFHGYDGNQQMIEDIQYDVYNIGDYVVRRAKPGKDALTLVYSI